MGDIESFANELRSTLSARRVIRQEEKAAHEAKENAAINSFDQFWKDSDKLLAKVVVPTLEAAAKQLKIDHCSCDIRKEGGEQRIGSVYAVFSIQEGSVDGELIFEVSPNAGRRTVKISSWESSVIHDTTKNYLEKELPIEEVSGQVIEQLFGSTLRSYLSENLVKL